MYKFNNMNKKILTFDLLCVIVKLTIKVVSLGELRPAQVSLITTHLVHKCVVMTLKFIGDGAFGRSIREGVGGGRVKPKDKNVMMSRQSARTEKQCGMYA